MNRDFVINALAVLLVFAVAVMLSACGSMPPTRDDNILECVENLRAEHSGAGWFNRAQDGELRYEEAVRHCAARFPV